MSYIKIAEDGAITSPIAKFLSEEEMKAIIAKAEANPGDVILIIADKAKVVYVSFGAMRFRIGKE